MGLDRLPAMASIGLLTLHLRIHHAQSLKDKRQVVRSLKDRLRGRFNVSVSELDYQDVWNRSLIGVVTVSQTEAHVRGVLEQVEREASNLLADFLDSAEMEFF
jgi:uncharacterized protein YlxP (DUF503 family)